MGSWPPTVFPGTNDEQDTLLAAIQAVCTCQRGQDGERVVCSAHALLLDERTLKYLIFYRRYRAVFWPHYASSCQWVSSQWVSG
jgi:hypothetical protein